MYKTKSQTVNKAIKTIEELLKKEEAIKKVEAFCESKEFEELTDEEFYRLDASITEIQELLDGLIDTKVRMLERSGFKKCIKENLKKSVWAFNKDADELKRVNSKVLLLEAKYICNDVVLKEQLDYIQSNLSFEMYQKLVSWAHSLIDEE